MRRGLIKTFWAVCCRCCFRDSCHAAAGGGGGGGAQAAVDRHRQTDRTARVILWRLLEELLFCPLGRLHSIRLGEGAKKSNDGQVSSKRSHTVSVYCELYIGISACTFYVSLSSTALWTRVSSDSTRVSLCGEKEVEGCLAKWQKKNVTN